MYTIVKTKGSWTVSNGVTHATVRTATGAKKFVKLLKSQKHYDKKTL